MPTDGDLKNEHGIDWRYDDPPGAWVVVQPNRPLELKPMEGFADDDVSEPDT